MNALTPDVVVRELGRESPDRWNGFVESCPQATFFHQASWTAAAERTFNHRAYFLYAEGAGRIRGVLPLLHVKSRLFGNSLISTGFGVYGGPATDAPSVAQLLDMHAVRLAESLDVDYLEYRSIARIRPTWACKEGIYATFQRPIDPDPDENLRAIPRKQRAVVRKSLLTGLSASLDDDVDSFYRLYSESVRNLGTPVFARTYFCDLKQRFGKRCEILIVREGNAPISGLMTFYFRDMVLPLYAGGTPAARRLGAFDFMYWNVLRRAGESGYRTFDFGRSKVGTGAFDFKKNWGFKPHPLSYEYWLRKGRKVPNVSPLNPKYRLFVAAWKRLPLPVANLIGPAIARNLG